MVTITNTGTGALEVPVTVPPGTTLGGARARPVLRRQPLGLGERRPGLPRYPEPERGARHHQRRLGHLQRGSTLQLHRQYDGGAGPHPHRERLDCPPV